MKSLTVLLNCLFLDLERLDPDVKGLDRDLETIKKRVDAEGVSFLTVVLPKLGKVFDKALSTGVFASPRGFKRLRGASIPLLFSGMTSKIFNAVTGTLRDDACLSAVKSVRQVCYFFKKLQLTPEDEDLLDQKAKKKFWDTDLVIRDFVPDVTKIRHLHRVCSYILPGLESWEEDYRFKHGPGAVAEGYTTNQKWSAIWSELLEGNFDFSGLGLDDFGLIDRIGVPSSVKATVPSRRLAKLVTVPKDSTSRRTITIEPVVHQYVQQGLNGWLRRKIDSCPVLSNSLALTDQSLNQKLALEGSLTGEWATLDLSSASDLLSCEAVRVVFWKFPTFLDRAFRCRSAGVKVPGGDSTLAKFAGMGNALTFPVQSVVFAMIAIAAIISSEGKLPTRRNVERTSRSVRVYGDDIIVLSKHYHQVVDWLEALGLRVNTDKSFAVGNFRESCGVDAFRGIDVTPRYLKIEPNATMDPSLAARLLETSNQLWDDCLYAASDALRICAQGSLKRLPLKHKDDGFLGLTNRWNARTYNSWSTRYQRPITRAQYVRPRKPQVDRLDGWPALLKSLTTPFIGRGRSHLEGETMKYQVEVKVGAF